MSEEKSTMANEKRQQGRRKFIKTMTAAGAAVAGGSVLGSVNGGEPGEFQDSIDQFFQTHYKRMSKKEMSETISRLKRINKRKHNVDINIKDVKPIEDVLFGYALNISKCKGYRKCVDACVAENNQNRDTPIQYIRVLEIDNNTMDFEKADHYYDHEKVPVAGKNYIPVQCHQCENPPCVTACPVKATWKEPDGVIVIDYNWCIGCRYCMASCPYWSRRFNWAEPVIPAEDVNPDTNYLSNRPRMKGCVEKCTFCLQRTREGQLPACLEACPTGARVFGNILDPKSEIRYILENKTVFRLKEDLATEPKFWYYTD